jgi:hypothetical protein
MKTLRFMSLALLQAILLVGAVNPPLPESHEMAKLSADTETPANDRDFRIAQERNRLKQQQLKTRLGFIVGLFVLNGILFTKALRRSGHVAQVSNSNR